VVWCERLEGLVNKPREVIARRCILPRFRLCAFKQGAGWPRETDWLLLDESWREMPAMLKPLASLVSLGLETLSQGGLEAERNPEIQRQEKRHYCTWALEGLRRPLFVFVSGALTPLSGAHRGESRRAERTFQGERLCQLARDERRNTCAPKTQPALSWRLLFPIPSVLASSGFSSHSYFPGSI
jgi:hypothetical protein